MTWKHKDMET
jgi:hypothetical protein